MATDYELMQNLITTDRMTNEPLFKDLQPKQLNDINNGSYSNGRIIIDTRDIVQEYTCNREMDLCIPLTICINDGVPSATNSLGFIATTSTTANDVLSVINGIGYLGAAGTGGLSTPVTGGTLEADTGVISFKQSILDLIEGVTITTGDGTQIVSENDSPKLINNLRLLIQNSKDWENTYANEFCFSKNTTATSVSSTNAGFKDRIHMLLNNSSITAYSLVASTARSYITRIQTVINIPMRYIHSFFDNCDSPMKGIRWIFSFNLPRELNPSSLYNAFVYNSSLCTGGIKAYIGADGGKAAPVINGNTYNNCFLRYDTISLPNNFQEKVSSLSLAGHLNTRYIKFATTEIYNSYLAQTAQLNSASITTGIVKPIRMWFFGCTAGALVSSTVQNTTNMTLQSFNVRVNNTNRFTQSLNSPLDLWEAVKEQMQALSFTNDKGSLINYNDFFTSSSTAPVVNGRVNGLYTYYCIDLCRLQERVDDQAISLIVDSVRSGSASSDYIVLVEREVTCKLEFNNNSVAVLVGSNL